MTHEAYRGVVRKDGTNTSQAAVSNIQSILSTLPGDTTVMCLCIALSCDVSEHTHLQACRICDVVSQVFSLNQANGAWAAELSHLNTLMRVARDGKSMQKVIMDLAGSLLGLLDSTGGLSARHWQWQDGFAVGGQVRFVDHLPHTALAAFEEGEAVNSLNIYFYATQSNLCKLMKRLQLCGRWARSVSFAKVNEVNDIFKWYKLVINICGANSAGHKV